MLGHGEQPGVLGFHLAGDLLHPVPDVEEQLGGGDDAVALRLAAVARQGNVGLALQGFHQGGGKGGVVADGGPLGGVVGGLLRAGGDEHLPGIAAFEPLVAPFVHGHEEGLGPPPAEAREAELAGEAAIQDQEGMLAVQRRQGLINFIHRQQRIVVQQLIGSVGGGQITGRAVLDLAGEAVAGVVKEDGIFGLDVQLVVGRQEKGFA